MSSELSKKGRGFLLTVPVNGTGAGDVELTEDKLLEIFPLFQKKHNLRNWTFQMESGEKTGYKHFQVYLYFNNPVSINTVKNLFEPYNRKPHVEIAKNPIAVKNYCSKSATRIGENYSSENINKVDLDGELKFKDFKHEIIWNLVKGDILDTYCIFEDKLLNLTDKDREKVCKKIWATKNNYELDE